MTPRVVPKDAGGRNLHEPLSGPLRRRAVTATPVSPVTDRETTALARGSSFCAATFSERLQSDGTASWRMGRCWLTRMEHGGPIRRGLKLYGSAEGVG